MSVSPRKGQSVVVLGVQGSGKTVFLSILGHTFDRVGAFGLQMTAKGGTWDYVSAAYNRMRDEFEWPLSTNKGQFVELSWEVKDVAAPLFTIDSIDCAGEEIVEALAPGFDSAAKDDSRDSGGGGDEFAAADSGNKGNDVKKLIAERVANASVVCLFINPNDFEDRITGEGDAFGSDKEKSDARNRSRDMRRLLQTFLDSETPPGSPKRIVLTITQSGRREVSNEMDELGGAKTYLFKQDGALESWRGTASSHIIAVSAVNNVVYKKKGTGEIVNPGEIDLTDAVAVEKKLEIREPWIGRRDRKRYVVPLEKPDVSDDNPSSGLVEFLLSVGGPLSDELARLDEALHHLRECQYNLSMSRRSGESSAERLAAAETLYKAWESYHALAETHIGKSHRRSAREKTRLYLEDEKSRILRWIVAEREIAGFLREAATAGTMPPMDASKVIESRIADALDKVWQSASGMQCHAATAYELSLSDSWIARQYEDFCRNRMDALDKFGNAIDRNDADTALDAIDELEKWGVVPEEVRADMLGRVNACREFIAEKSKRAGVARTAKDMLDKAALAIRDADRLANSNAFGAARDKVAEAGNAVSGAKADVEPLLAGTKKYADGRMLANLLEKIEKFGTECANTIKNIDQREKDFNDELERKRIAREKHEREIAEKEARKRRNKRRAVAIAAILIAVFSFSKWLGLRSDEEATLRKRWNDALAEASRGKYANATARISTIQDKPSLMISRASIVDEKKVQRIANGEGFRQAKEAADSAWGNLLKDEEAILKELDIVGRQEKYAKAEWSDYLKAKNAASGAMPKLELDALGLPATLDAMREALSGFDSASKKAADAKSALNAFRKAAKSALDEESRRLRIAKSRDYLESTTPQQGWTELAKALPAGGVDGWLDLADGALSEKREAFLRTGLPKEAKTPVLNGEEAKKAFDTIRSEAPAEWLTDFAKEAEDCSKVLAAVAKIDSELSRRNRIRKAIDKSKAEIAAKKWNDAEMFLDDAQKLLSKRNVDAGFRKEYDSAKVAIAEGKTDEALAEIEAFYKANRIRDAALEFGKIGEPSGKNAALAKSLRSSVETRLRDSIKDAIKTGKVLPADFKTGSRFCFDVEGFGKVAETALSDGIDAICPASLSGNFEPDWETLKNVRSALRLSRPKEAGKMGDRVSGWCRTWLDGARIEADKARTAKSVVDKMKYASSTEQWLSKVEKYEAFRDGSGLLSMPSFSDSIRVEREKLPPVLQVSLLSTNGKTYIDAYSLAKKPKAKYLAEHPNPETEKKDLLAATSGTGSMLAFSFKGESETLGRPSVTFDWHGIRHVIMRLDSMEVLDYAK